MSPFPPHPLSKIHPTSLRPPQFCIYPPTTQLNQSSAWTTPFHSPDPKPSLNWPHILLHPRAIFCHFNVLFIHTSSSQSFSFLVLILFFSLPTGPTSLSSSIFLFKTWYSSHHHIPLSSLSFSTTILTSQLSSIPSNLLLNNTFISSLLSSSPRSPCTATWNCIACLPQQSPTHSHLCPLQFSAYYYYYYFVVVVVVL